MRQAKKRHPERTEDLDRQILKVRERMFFVKAKRRGILLEDHRTTAEQVSRTFETATRQMVGAFDTLAAMHTELLTEMETDGKELPTDRPH